MKGMQHESSGTLVDGVRARRTMQTAGFAFALFLLVCLALPLRAYAADEVRIATDTTWDSDVLSALTGDVTYTIPAGVTLTLDAPQTVQSHVGTITFKGGGTIMRGELNTGCLFTLNAFVYENCIDNTLVFDNITVDGNKGLVSTGQLIYLNKSGTTVYLKGTTSLQNNWCEASGQLAGGGAIYCNAANGRDNHIYMQGAATIQNNLAVQGGGLFLGSAYDTNGTVLDRGRSYLHMQDAASIKKNEATCGGGIYFNNDAGAQISPIEMSDTSVIGGLTPSEGNVAQYGGGIYVYRGNGAFYLAGGNIAYNRARATTTGEYGYGGGIYVLGGIAEISTSAVTIHHNTADFGGGICASVREEYVIRTVFSLSANVQVTDNIALYDGGGLYELCDVVSQNYTSEDGNGVYAKILKANIANNKAGRDGGGVYVGSTTTSTWGGLPAYANAFIYDTAVITGNSAGRYGGGVCVMSNPAGATHQLDAQEEGLTPASTIVIIGGTGESGDYSANLMLYGAAEISNNAAGSAGGGVYTNTNLAVAEMPSVANNNLTGDEPIASNVFFDFETRTGIKTHFSCPMDPDGDLMSLSPDASLYFSLVDAHTDDVVLSHDDETDCVASEIDPFVFEGNEQATLKIDDSPEKPSNMLINIPGTVSSKKAIVAFSLAGVAATIDQVKNTITAQVPVGTSLVNLAPEFTLLGENVKLTVNEIEQQSGASTQSFAEPLTYTVVGADNLKRSYTVTVTRDISSTAALTAYELSSYDGTSTWEGTINHNDNSIAVHVPYGTDVTQLVASFTKAATGDSVKVDGVSQTSTFTANDFSTPVTYTVSNGGLTQEYIVTVTQVRDPGETFTYNIPFVPSDPSSYDTTVACGFTALTYPLGETPGTVACTGVDRATAGSISIPQTVTNASGEVFTVTSIAKNAFGAYYIYQYGGACLHLTGIELPDTITSIGEEAFSNTSSETLSIPASVKFIGKRAFHQTSNYVVSGEVEHPLKTLIFEGNTSDLETAKWFGGGDAAFCNIDTLANVVFMDKCWSGIQSTLMLAGSPSMWYTVDFYANEADAIAGANVLGTATIRDDVKTGDINSELASDYVWSGSVPSYPQDMLAWSFEGGVGRQEKLADSCYAFATDVLSDEKALTAFSLAGEDATIDEEAHTIDITLPYGTELSQLAASFTCSRDASVMVDGTLQQSGVTTNDFSGEVVYTVVAADGSTQDYTVTANWAANTEKRLLSFSVGDDLAFIDEVDHELTLSLPTRSDLSALTVTFTVSPQAQLYCGQTLLSSGVSVQDFSAAPLTYTVEAGDGSTQEYRLAVELRKIAMDTTQVESLPNMRYAGSPLTPKPVVRYNKVLLVEGTDYTLSYENNDVVGDDACAIITGMGDFTGSIRTYFSILDERIAKSYAGLSRYETAQAIALAAYPSGSQYAIVATGENYPDTLSASGLAGLLDCPIVMTASAGLTTAARQALVTLGATHIIIVGGDGVVSEDIARELGALDGVEEVTRLAGSDRYATCQAIYDYGKDVGAGWQGLPIVATGGGFADALSIAPYAFAQKSPLFLVGANGFTDDIASALKTDYSTQDVIVIGGTGVVSTEVEAWIGDELNSVVTRLAGNDRYLTGREVVNYCITHADFSCGTVTFATGANFADALAGGVLCGKNLSPLVLCDDYTLGTSGIENLDTHAEEVTQVIFLGGTGVLSDTFRSEILEALGGEFEIE